MSGDIKRKALVELARRKKREQWRRNPMLWVEERLGEDPKSFDWSLWGDLYNDHEWDGDKNPLAEAWRTISNAYIASSEGRNPDSRIVCLEAATGTGKTYTLARIVYWFLDCFPNSLVVTTAPVKEQLTSGLWSELSLFMSKIKTHHPSSSLYTLRLNMDDKTAMKRSSKLDESYEDSYDGWKAISHIAGSGADETSAVKARGFHRQYMLIVLEECSGMDWAVVNAFVNTCTGSYNYIVAVGNPNNKHDSLNMLATQNKTKALRVSAYDHPNIVLKKEVFHGAITQVSIDERKDTYGEGSRLYDAMVRGISPEQAYNSLIHADWLDGAIDREPSDSDITGACGVDVAASENGDKGAVAFGKGPTLKYIREFQCPNATYLASNLLIERANRIESGIPDYDIPSLKEYNVVPEYVGIDGVGVGVATVEKFTNDGHNVHSLQGGSWEEGIPIDPYTHEPKWRFNTLRSQMYYEAREDLRKGLVSISITDKVVFQKLRKELLTINFEKNEKVIAIEGKEIIKKKLGGKSPNLADAFVYWNWIRKGYRANRTINLMFASG